MFTDEVERIFNEAVGPLRPSDQTSDEALQKEENRLGFKLPASLRTYYSLCGRHALNHRLHPLRAPAELSVEDGYVVYADEVQNVVRYGFKVDEIGMEDPPVYLLNVADGKWHQCERMTTALVHLLCWQVVNGIGSMAGTFAVGRTSLRARQWLNAHGDYRLGGPPDPNADMEAYLVDGVVVVSFPGHKKTFAGSRDSARLTATAHALDLDVEVG